MARKSNIDRLPEEVRDLIARLREQGRTIDEILGRLRELDVTVSRSALGAHTKELDELAEMLRESWAMAIGAVEALGQDPDDRVARVTTELMQSLLFKALRAKASGDEVALDAEEAMFWASTLQKLSATKRSDLELRGKIEQRVRDQLAREQAERAEQAVAIGARRGLSADAVAAMKAAFLGLS